MSEENKDFKHIVRIVNTDLKGNKPILQSLRKIKGIGFSFANMICNFTGIDKNKITGELTDEEEKKLNEAIINPMKLGAPVWMLNRRKDYDTGKDKHLLTGDIGFTVGNDVKRLRMIKSYKGFRHAAGLPLRGQRTKSNFRRNKGKVMGVKRKAGAKGGRV